MNKKILVLCTILMMVTALVFGCATPEEEAPSAAPTQLTSQPDTTPEPVVETTPEPEPEDDAVIPENMSPTTGRLDTTTTYGPVMVQIDNEGGGRARQMNLQQADVVYETLIEGVDTRLSAIFNDVIYKDDAPDKLTTGPIRSSRYYHQWIQGEWDALYVHMGGPDSTNNPESDIWGDSGDHVKQRINGAGKGTANSNMFYKNDRGESISDYAMTDVIADAEIYNYTPKEREPFQYYPLEDYADEKEIEKIDLSFLKSPGFVSYTYDPATDLLTRYFNGDESIDHATGDPIQVQNLIVQFTTVTTMPNDSPRQLVNMFGEGPAEFIIHGKHLTGTWKRADNSESTEYYLDNGDEVTFAPGNTWIAVHPNTKAVEVTYQDGSTYDSHE